jgi:hypothetical protein
MASTKRRSLRCFIACVALPLALVGCGSSNGAERVGPEGAGANAGQGPTGTARPEDPVGRAAGGSGMPVPR